MKLSERLSLASGFAITAVMLHGFFLIMVYKMFGRLPGESAITLTANHVFDLGFAVSGWYTLLMGPLFIFPASIILTSKYLKDSKAWDALVFTMIVWVFVSIAAGLYGGMHYGIYVGTAIALGLTTRIHNLNTLYEGLLMSLGAGLLVFAKSGLLSCMAVVAILAALTVVITMLTALFRVAYDHA